MLVVKGEKITKDKKEILVQQWKWGQLTYDDLSRFSKMDLMFLVKELGIKNVKSAMKVSQVIQGIVDSQSENVTENKEKMEQSKSIQLVNNTLPTTIIKNILLYAWKRDYDIDQKYTTAEVPYTDMMINKAIYQSVISVYNHHHSVWFESPASIGKYFGHCEKNPYFSQSNCSTVVFTIDTLFDTLEYINNNNNNNNISSNIKKENNNYKERDIESLRFKLEEISIIDNKVEDDVDEITPIFPSNHSLCDIIPVYFPNLTVLHYNGGAPLDLLESLVNISTIRDICIDSCQVEQPVTIRHPIHRIESFRNVIQVSNEFKSTVKNLDCHLVAGDSLIHYTGVTRLTSLAIESILQDNLNDKFKDTNLVLPNVVELELVNTDKSVAVTKTFQLLQKMFPNLKIIKINGKFMYHAMSGPTQVNVDVFQYLYDTKSISKLLVNGRYMIGLNQGLVFPNIGFEAGSLQDNSPYIYYRIVKGDNFKPLQPKSEKELESMSLPKLLEYTNNLLHVPNDNIPYNRIKSKPGLIRFILDSVYPIYNTLVSKMIYKE